MGRPEWEKEKSIARLSDNYGLKIADTDLSDFTTIKEMNNGYVQRIVEDDTMPDYRFSRCLLVMDDGNRLQCPCPDYPEPITGPVKKVIRYYAPFDKCDREEDYETVWNELDRRGS